MESAGDNRTSPPSPNLRAYLAGGGATAALVAAAVVVFVSVAAFVGFNGLPFGSDESPESTVVVTSGAPLAAATAAAPTADAVAARPARPSDAAAAEIIAALPPGAAPPSGSARGGGSGTDTPTTGDGTGPGPAPPVDPPGPGPGTAGPGPLGNAVGGVEDTVNDLSGLDLPLGDLTDDVTKPLDEAVNGTLNGAGGLLGANKLGDKVGNGLGGLTDELLP